MERPHIGGVVYVPLLEQVRVGDVVAVVDRQVLPCLRDDVAAVDPREPTRVVDLRDLASDPGRAAADRRPGGFGAVRALDGCPFRGGCSGSGRAAARRGRGGGGCGGLVATAAAAGGQE